VYDGQLESVESHRDPAKLYLYSSTGALVGQAEMDDEIQIDLSGLHPGLYLLKIARKNREAFVARISKL
jgi:hypothetical protein